MRTLRRSVAQSSLPTAFILANYSQAIERYRQMIPQFDDFVNQMQPQDAQALRANYL